jgi:hypothetical protein
MKKKLFAGLLGLMIIGTSGVASATPAVSFTSPILDFANITDLVGWQFTVNNNITVNALGFYDNPANGITGSHDIGIYNDATQSLVVSGTVSPSDPYSNWFNWKSVAQTVLTAGQTYDIVAVLNGNNRTWDPNGFTVDPNIAYVKNVWSNGTSTLSFPTSTDGNPTPSYFGPNFEIASAGVPEPSTIALTIIGLAGFGFGKRRKLS